ncbi:pseudoazurin [Algicella marina]|uniref:Pseudoazurin n=1 Tax=Algicella marina TaxID=2683284 RepID=A0A6P1T478_9RHOB|nr:pseudoazurin [Algicella marina]QHQ36571.1 pseudoazurin [Algicella marina]
MKLTRREHLGLIGSAFVVTASGLPLAARAEPKTIEVMMLNKDPDDPSQRMVFKPAVVRANPGDTIRFVSADKNHNTESTAGMLPEGGEEWRSKLNEDFDVTVSSDGTYGFHCTPHKALGMVGLILVGDAMVNFEEARGVRQRGKAKARYEDYFTQAEEMLKGES